MKNTYYSDNTQSVEMLEASRLTIMNKELTKTIVDKLSIKENMKVLDVGCGIGEFSFYLGKETNNVNYYGVDSDSTFIEKAKTRAKDENSNNYTFVLSDATKLPFEDEEFDVVISQAFLTVCFFYEDAFKEMLRVCKKGGLIGTLNPIDFMSLIEEKNSGYTRYSYLKKKSDDAYQILSQKNNMYSGINPRHIPLFFKSKELKDIEVYPVGQFFSLDNKCITNEIKSKYIALLLKSERKKIDYLLKQRNYYRFISKNELDEYYAIIDSFISNNDYSKIDTEVWDYEAIEFLLTTGIKDKDYISGEESNRYKDEDPLITVNRIKNILNDLNLQIKEDYFQSGIDGLYSCIISIKGTDIYQCGKGTSAKYALASGYAEFMERLQTGFLFPFKSKDEKLISGDELMIKGGNLLNECFSSIYKLPSFMIDTKTVIDKWDAAFNEGKTIVYPFINIETNEINYLPEFIYRGFEYTNGSCAGNTKEEALVQGISEIIERYAAKIIISKKLTPPTIPDEVLRKNKRLFLIIENIRNITNDNLFVFDASLNEDLPVVGVCLVSKKNKTIRLRFGCHPNFEIALERALAEMYQGIKIDSLTFNYPIGYEFEDIVPTNKNMFHMLKFGKGAVSTSILSKNESYPYTKFKDVKESNKEKLNYLLGICKKHGWNVYYRDCSFFGFDTYHVIIPQISLILADDNFSVAQVYHRIKNMKVFRKYEFSSEEEKEEALNALRLYSGWKVHDSVDYMANIKFNAELFSEKIDYNLLKVLRSIHNKDYIEASKLLSKYAYNKNNKMWALYELCNAASNNDIDNGISFIKNFLENNDVEEVINIFDNPYSIMPNCDYPYCKNCTRKGICDRYFLEGSFKNE